ncbi:MAG: hypothetical protein R3C26_22880 [Calditrichia bacterium]
MGCGGVEFPRLRREPNRLPQFYHSGSSDDLETVINHIRGLGKYEKIDLVGFSMGGNITLKYLGEKPAKRRRKSGERLLFLCRAISNIPHINWTNWEMRFI